MISPGELREYAADPATDPYVRFVEHACGQAADTIDALIGMLHDYAYFAPNRRRPGGQLPLWWCLSEEAKDEVRATILRMAEQKVARDQETRENIHAAARPGGTGAEALAALDKLAE